LILRHVSSLSTQAGAEFTGAQETKKSVLRLTPENGLNHLWQYANDGVATPFSRAIHSEIRRESIFASHAIAKASVVTSAPTPRNP
jgi:hypothetical protein